MATDNDPAYIDDYDDSNLVRDDDLIEVPDELLEGLGFDDGKEEGGEPAHTKEAKPESEPEDEEAHPSLTEEFRRENEERAAKGQKPMSRSEKRVRAAKWEAHEAQRQAQAEAQKRAELEAILAQYQQQTAAQQNQASLEALQDKRKAMLGEIRQLRDSFDDSDDDKADALELELRELDAEVVTLKRGAPAIQKRKEQELTPHQEQRQAEQKLTPQEAKAAELAADWINATPAYNQNAAFRAKADALFDALERDEGYNPAHPGFYKEFNKRLTQSKPYSGSTGGPARGNEGGHDSGGKSGSFTDEDARVMRMSGQDPRNPQHRARYIANLREFGG